ncbi:CopG family transcriptional regulator [Sebaldella sp. S0638]|nr:CopG family transcriptional regulator [Sebaldella sp. S0638]MCP1224854.1 ribbon-helix-helix domain-containing protein [Sebaldella sp. S0638]
MKRTQIYLPEEQVKELKYIAIEEETNVSEIIRRLVDEYLSKRKK